jgi:hypothetical protein
LTALSLISFIQGRGSADASILRHTCAIALVVATHCTAPLSASRKLNVDVLACPRKVHPRHSVHLRTIEVVDDYVSENQFPQLFALRKYVDVASVNCALFEVAEINEINRAGRRIKHEIPYVLVAIGCRRVNFLDNYCEYVVIFDKKKYYYYSYRGNYILDLEVENEY